MQFNKTVNMLLENFGDAAQDMQTGFNIGMKQLTHNIVNSPQGSVVALLDLIKRSPGMHADLLAGNMHGLHQKFLHMGVDFAKIANLVSQARALAEKEKRGGNVAVRKAMPVNEQWSPEMLMDYYFEDLYHVTNHDELLHKIRQRVETPEVKQKLGPAKSGNMVEQIYMYIKQRQSKNMSAVNEKSVHDAVRPGILKRQVKGKMTCSKARGIKSKQKNKGNNTAKAAQRYINYHC